MTESESLAGADDTGVRVIAQALVQARDSLADTHPAVLADAGAWDELSAQQAYRIQARVAHQFRWFADGPPLHWKSGGASRDAVLTHAPLPPGGVWRSPARAGTWPFAFRGIEAEIALRLSRSVDAETARVMTPEAANGLIEAMAVSIEVVDSRWRQGMATPAMLKLADLQSHGALVLGDWVPYRALDWLQQVCRVQVGQQAEVMRQGTHSLGDPAWLLPTWLRHACSLHGEIPAGTVVTTGTWVGILPAQAGDRVQVVFDGIGEASVQL
jgi:2-keto-4-pentenoate hydratase